jgi:hypothetical protein
MKLGMGLLNVPTVANSAGNLVNPGFVRIFYPVYGMGWDKGPIILCAMCLMAKRKNNLRLTKTLLLVKPPLSANKKATTTVALKKDLKLT